MSAVKQQAFAFRAAVTFLTRIPFGRCSCTLPSGAAGHFPAVGTLVGGLGSLAWRASRGLDVTLSAWLVTAVLLLVTGAFHEDGLADTADALGGAFDRKRLFEILKDSRVGSFGAVALIAVLSLRVTLYRDLLPKHGLVLVLSQTLSRLPPVLMLRALPYVTSPQVSRSQGITAVGTGQVVQALLWSALVIVVCAKVGAFAWLSLGFALGVQLLLCTWLGYRFVRRAGGLTGDFLGATQQLGELAFLLGLARAMC